METLKSHFSCLFLALFAFFAIAGPLMASDYYWVNGSGLWNDYANHWATSSGGSTMHTAPPDFADDVHFDGNSFTAPGQFVQTDTTHEYKMRSMDWTGVQYQPEFRLGGWLWLYGDLKFSPDMVLTFSGEDLLGDGSGIVFDGVGAFEIHFDPAGLVLGSPTAPARVLVQDRVILDGDLRLARSDLPNHQSWVWVSGGLLKTTGHYLEADRIYILPEITGNQGAYSGLIPGSSTIVADFLRMGCGYDNFVIPHSGEVLLDGDSSATVWVRELFISECFYDAIQYSFPNMHFSGNDTKITATNVVHPGLMVFTGSLIIDSTSNFTADVHLLCMGPFEFNSPGAEMVLDGHFRFEDEVSIQSEWGNRTQIASPGIGITAVLEKDSGTVCVSHADISRIDAGGGALWKAVAGTVLDSCSGWTSIPNLDCSGQVASPEPTTLKTFVEVFPNPANSMIQVQCEGEPGKHYELFMTSIDGRQWRLGPAQRNSWKIDVSGFVPGLYLLELRHLGHVEVAKKLIVE